MGSCTVKADCVPAQCYPPTTCTSKAKAPNCADIFCTADCKPDTMDCGQGYCDCQNGQCVAVINGSI